MCECRRIDPGLKCGVIAPARDHQPGCPVIGGLEKLEALEPVLFVHSTCPRGEPAGQFVAAIGSHRDCIDLDDSHPAMMAEPSQQDPAEAVPSPQAGSHEGERTARSFGPDVSPQVGSRRLATWGHQTLRPAPTRTHPNRGDLAVQARMFTICGPLSARLGWPASPTVHQAVRVHRQRMLHR
jgi:hypothetical protein